jgi:dienelactone hydrolase
MIGYVAYDANLKGERPGILVIHEWWGNNDYSKMRARMLAELGYIAFAIDMYGDGKIAENPEMAMELSSPLYKEPEIATTRINAALHQLKNFPETDASKIAIIGYCFGGSMALNAGKMGVEVLGVVSFHGGLKGVPVQDGISSAMFLICQGGADEFVSEEEIQHFKEVMENEKIPFQFKVYKNATHAFTNPDATEIGKKFNLPIAYNKEADIKSWKDMQIFLKTIFK